MSQQFPLTSHISIKPFSSQNPISKLRTKQSFCPEVKFNRNALGQGSSPGFMARAYPEGTKWEASRGGKCTQTPTAGDCSCWPLVPGMGEGACGSLGRSWSMFFPSLEYRAPCCLQETKANFWPFALMIKNELQGLSLFEVFRAEAVGSCNITCISNGRAVSSVDTCASLILGRWALCLSLPEVTGHQSHLPQTQACFFHPRADSEGLTERSPVQRQVSSKHVTKWPEG